MRQASNIAACAAIALAILGVGGVHTAVAVAVCALAFLAVVSRLIRLRRGAEARDLHVSLLGGALGLLGVTAMLQLVPLPDILHRVLNPTGHALTEQGLALTGVTLESWRPLSLDPAATADRAVRFVALFLIAVWGANAPSRGEWWHSGNFVVGVSVLTLFIGSFLHVTEATSYFGLYQPNVGFRGLSPFISTNHGATFFGWAAIAAVGTSLHYRHRGDASIAVLLGLAGVGFAGVAVYHRSDGVLLAMGLSTLVALVLLWFKLGRPTRVPRDVAIGLGLIAVASLGAFVWLDVHVAAWSFAERVLFSGEHGARYELMQSGAAAAGDYWRFGAGAGSVETVIAGYIDWSVVGHVSVPLLENDTFELVVGFGFLVGGAAVLAFAAKILLALDAATSPERSDRHAVAVVSAVYFAIVAQLHFPLFALGIGIPFVAWLEVLWSRRNHPSGNRRIFGTGHVALPWSVASALVLVVMSAAVFASIAHYRWSGIELPEEPSGELTREFMRLRPADHRIYVRLAVLSARAGDIDRAIELADHAVSREPSGRVKLVRARTLALKDEARAVQAYRELFDSGKLSGAYISSFVSDIRDPVMWAEALDDYPDAWLPTAQNILETYGPEPASTFIVELASRHPERPEPYRVASRLYLQMQQPLLARLWAQILDERERADASDERDAPVFLAQSLIRGGQPDQALRVLNRVLEEDGVHPQAHRLAFRLSGSVDADEERIATIREHHDRLCSSPIPAVHLKECWLAEAWIAEAQGRHTDARQVLSRVQRRFDTARPLADFYMRSGRCRSLVSLAHSLPLDSPERERIETLVGRCRQ